MIRLYAPNQPLMGDQFLITVHSFFRTHQWTFVVPRSYTLRELACALRDYVDAAIYEMSFFPLMDNAVPYPYPLRDDMHLDRLQEEHRHLVVLIHENPEKAIPRRLLIESPHQRPSLNMVEATDQDIPYLSDWITFQVRKVYLPWSHPLFSRMMDEITETLDAVDFPRSFAYQYILVGPSHQEGLTLSQRNALLRFFRVIGQDRVFRRIEVYAEKGICGNTNEEPMMLTEENMRGIDLLIADAIAQRER